jgi:hypothetical protein
MPMTLQQRIEAAVARKQFWFDPPDSPDMHIHCSFCQSSLLIDYFQFGKAEMDIRLMAWANHHALCSPGLATRTKDMSLTPKERSRAS